MNSAFAFQRKERNCHTQCWLKGLHLLPVEANAAVLPHTKAEFTSLCSWGFFCFYFFPTSNFFFTAGYKQSVEK